MLINILMFFLVAQSCPALWDPMDYSLPGSSVHGILQARILKWVAIPFSKGSTWLGDLTWVSSIAGKFFTMWATILLLKMWYVGWSESAFPESLLEMQIYSFSLQKCWNRILERYWKSHFSNISRWLCILKFEKPHNRLINVCLSLDWTL